MAAGLRLLRLEYHQWIAKVAAKFKQLSEAGEADKYHTKARMHDRYSRGELDDPYAGDSQADASSLRCSREGLLRTVVSDRGTFTELFTTSDFESQICDQLHVSRVGGYGSCEVLFGKH